MICWLDITGVIGGHTELYCFSSLVYSNKKGHNGGYLLFDPLHFGDIEVVIEREYFPVK